MRRCSESVAQPSFLEKAVYILPSLSFLSTPSLPTRAQLKRAWQATVTIVLWAVALTFTAGRLSRQLWETVRPGLARLLHALALLLDGGLAYPDQPEPDPTPDLGLGRIGSECPSCGRDNSEYGNICTADDCPGAGADPRPTHIKITPSPEMLAALRHVMDMDDRIPCDNELPALDGDNRIRHMAAGDLLASSRTPAKPRAARRRTTAKAAAKGAA